MGEGSKDALRVNFDRKSRLEFHGVKVASDAGLLAYREIDDVFGLTDMIACELRDKRTGKNTQHNLLALLRQSVYPPKADLAGYEDTNDAERLCVDPAMRQVVGELFPRIGFIVTNLRWKSSNVVKFYNRHGTTEQWIKKGKYALKWTRLSCHDFIDSQVRLQLFALAYNLGNFLRRLALPKSIKDWSLRTMRERLVKIGAKVVKYARYVIFQLAEVLVSKSLFYEILERIDRLKPAPIESGRSGEFLKTWFYYGADG